MAYRIKNWNTHYENNRSRDLKRADWFPCPNGTDGTGFMELMDHPAGMSHYGAWILLLGASSRMPVRGLLVSDSKKPLTLKDLARMSRGSFDVFTEAMSRILAIGWVEEIPDEEAVSHYIAATTVLEMKTDAPADQRHGAGKSQAGAAIPHQSAEKSLGKGRGKGQGREGERESEKESKTLPPTPPSLGENSNAGDSGHSDGESAAKDAQQGNSIPLVPPCPVPALGKPSGKAPDAWWMDLREGERSFLEAAIYLDRDHAANWRRDLAAIQSMVEGWGLDRTIRAAKGLVVHGKPPFATKVRDALRISDALHGKGAA